MPVGTYGGRREIMQCVAPLGEAFGDRVCVNQIGSLMSIFFTDKPVADMDTAMTSDTKQYAVFFPYMFDHGINLAPSQFEAMFISDAHTEEDIRKTIDVMKEFAHR